MRKTIVRLICFFIPMSKSKFEPKVEDEDVVESEVEEQVWREEWRIKMLHNNCHIMQDVDALLDKGTMFSHPLGIVIHPDAKIGENCKIFHNVTIGERKGKVPIIKNNVILFSNCVITGPVTIGDNVIVAPGSIVLKDVPANSVVAGNPAKIIKQR